MNAGPARLDEWNGVRTFGDRYRVLRPLRVAGGVSTLVARDLAKRREVIVKTVETSAISEAARERVVHGVGMLAQVASPWLAAPLDVGLESDLFFVVQPKCEGITLRALLSETGPLPLEEALLVVRCVLNALEAAHELGVFHQNIKPANVMVEPHRPLEGAMLVDFGLSRSGLLGDSIRETSVEAAQYVSPEQAGLLDREVKEGTDLYGVGLLLFECLTGRFPFAGPTISDLLRQHLSAPPPGLRVECARVPRAVEEVFQRLLRKDPRDRDEAAAAGRGGRDAIADLLSHGIEDPLIAIGSGDERRALTRPAFIGRGIEMDALEARLERARAGFGGMVVVQGEAGAGKSRILDKFAEWGRQSGAWMLRGQGADRAAQRPLGPLAGVVQEVLSAGHANPGLAREIGARLGDMAGAACDAIPELAEMLGIELSGTGAGEADGERRNLRALRAFIGALGSAKQPAVLLLDDCQWADDLTVKLLASWHESVERGENPGPHVLVVAAFRVGELAAQRALAALPGVESIMLEPFSREETRCLVESMAGTLPSEALGVVVRLSQGSPFMASAVLHGLVESGALIPDRAGWRVGSEALADLQSSHEAAVFLARRIALLPSETIRILSIGAVLGKEFDIDVAGRLRGQSEAEAADGLREAVRRHIVWFGVPSGRCIFVHDLLRDAFLERLDPEEKRALHWRAAVELESQGRGSAFELAYHFDAAGECARALPHALAAAESARTRLALGICEQNYRIAERGVSEGDRLTRQRIAEGLGTVLMLRGAYTEAVEYVRQSLSLVDEDDRLTRVRLGGTLGELAFKQGEVDEADELLREALHLLGRGVPRTRVLLVASLVKECLVQLLHRTAPGFFVGRRPPAKGEADLLAVRLYMRLGLVRWLQGGAARVLWTGLRTVNLAERYPPTAELGLAYSGHGLVVGLVFPRLCRVGQSYLERSLAVSRSVEDARGEGQGLLFLGVSKYAECRYAEAIENCEQAARVLERTGDRWQLNTANWHRAFCQYRLGDLSAAVELSRRVHFEGLAIGDAEAVGQGLEIWAKASGGEIPEELVQRQLHHLRGGAQTTTAVLQAEAIRLLGNSRPLEAVAMLERAHQMARKSKVRNVYVSAVLAWHATALRQAIEAEPPWSARHRRNLTRHACKVARAALRAARTYRNDLPHVLRELGLIRAMRGRHWSARRLLDRSVAVSEHQGARYERAQTLQARGMIGATLGWLRAADDLADAERELASLRAEPAPEVRAGRDGQARLSVLGRLDALLDVGRRIVSADSSEAISSAVHDAAMMVLRAEECAVVELPTSGRIEDAVVVAGHADVAHLNDLLNRVVRTRGPVVSADWASGGPGRDALLPSVDARSVLCVPIFVGDRVASCLYAAHHHVAGIFGEEEVDLAEFVASLAGAARQRENLRQETLAKVIDAQEAERARFARDLHDEIGQALTSVLLELRLVQDSLEAGPSASSDALAGAARARDTAFSALASARDLALRLRPSVLDDLGLIAGLNTLARDVMTRHGIDVDLTISGLPGGRFGHEIETAIYRVAQEALTNVVRHANAPACSVVVGRSGHRLRMVIADGGDGFDPRRVSEGSLGLKGMAERAGLVGGTVVVDSKIGVGTTVVLEVPLG